MSAISERTLSAGIIGKAIERASIAELEALLREESPELDLEAEVERLEDHIDHFTLMRMLLEHLEGVKQSPKYHPEGDALYHMPSIRTMHMMIHESRAMHELRGRLSTTAAAVES